MDRLQYIGSTHRGQLVTIDDIVNYFDKVMATYDLIGGIESVVVKGDIDNFHSTIRITATNIPQEEAEKVVNEVNQSLHNSIHAYDRNFYISARNENSSLELSVKDF